jgi:hypothetical protein
MTLLSTKCSVCHGDLPDPKGVCPGRLPGPLGLVQWSPGKCLSTPLQRIQVDARRREAAAREAANKRDSRGAKADVEDA